MIDAVILKSYPDIMLDDLYATNFDAGYVSDYTAVGLEILGRLQSVGSFVKGIFGFDRFPQYTARQKAGGFTQIDAARSSVADNASAVVNKIGDTVSNIGGGVKLAIIGVIVLGLAFIIFKVKNER
jgi:hypothetical protein